MVEKYLSTLIPGQKCLKPQENVEVGNLVLLKDPNVVKNSWSRTRILKLFPNKDGYVRCVELIKPNKSICVRDVRNICKLGCNVYE